MLIVHAAAELEPALRSLMKTHHLKAVPDTIKEVYRPFWLGKVYYQAEDRGKQPVAGTVVFLADARILTWSIIGAYQHQAIESVLDLRSHQVDFVASEQAPPDGAEILEPLLTQAELSTKSRLLSSRRLLARTMKLGKVQFEDDVEYHLIYRPYWEVEFPNRRGDMDVALIGRDNILVRKR